MDSAYRFLAIGAIHLLAVMSPGPDFLLVVKNTLGGATRGGVMTALGISLGNLVQVGAVLVGAAIVFTPGSRALFVVKLLGAIYLMWLGFKALRGGKTETSPLDGTGAPRGVSDLAAVASGLMTNLTNVKAWLYWISIGSQLLVNPPLPVGQSCAVGAALVGIVMAWFTFVAAVLGSGAVRARIAGSYWMVERGLGVLLMSYGVGMAWEMMR